MPNHLFWDSDVAKWIEGACYFLHDAADAAVDAAVTELVEMIRGAAQPDGYINIHFTVVAKGQRFTNLRDLHELYNAGHMVEAAVAHAAHYKNYSLLEPISRYVRLLADRFGPREGQKHGYPGHPEIELALLRLFEHSKDSHHYDLAKYFIEERGKSDGQDGRHFFEVEAEMRGERENEMPRYYPEKKSYWLVYRILEVSMASYARCLGTNRPTSLLSSRRRSRGTRCAPCISSLRWQT